MTLGARAWATIGEILDGASLCLRGTGVENARRDARLLLAHALATEVEVVLGYPERPVSTGALIRYNGLIERRMRREPVSRILGRREFWGLPFCVSPDSFDPRPDSEVLVDAILRRMPDRLAPVRLLDLGSGTGCLILALLSELPWATGLGVDISEAAIACATANAQALGLSQRVSFQCSNWGDGVDGHWQVIVSNPPYIMDEAMSRLPDEVRLYDPPIALSGGADGLSAYRMLAVHVRRLLAPDGAAAIEVGSDNGDSISALFSEQDLTVIGICQDLSGHDRCLLVTQGAGVVGSKKKKLESRGLPSRLTWSEREALAPGSGRSMPPSTDPSRTAGQAV